MIYVVDASSEDEQGDTVYKVLNAFDVDPDGLLVPHPRDVDYPGVATADELRAFLGNSSFLGVWDELPPGAVFVQEPRGSNGASPDAVS